MENAIEELPENYRTARKKLRAEYQPQINELNKQTLTIKQEIGDLKAKLVDTGVDVGPAIYLAKVFKSDVDTVVSFFMLVLIFVFDPLAVMLVIAFNQALMIKEEEESGQAGISSNTNTTTKKWWEMFGEKKPKKIAKVLDKLKNDDSDSGEILKPDIDDIPPVKEKTKEKTSGRGAVQVL